MVTADDEGSTQREYSAASRGRGSTPVLLVGSFLPGAGQVVGLDRPVTIGRGPTSAGADLDTDSDVILRADSTLSRPHLRIVPGKPGVWTVEDLASTNGTFVNGRQVKEPMPLSDGSIVLFGSHAGVFRTVSADELDAIVQERASPFGPVATLSPELAVTLAGLRRLARTDASLLFVGETGVGKEVYARAVHAASGRRGEFVAVNCAALPSELAESELYGYERGAHSTATRAKQGLVEVADKGTLLLDEIGDMSPRMQAKLFRFLQDRQVLALGATRTRPVDVRIIAATSQVSESVRSDLVGRLGAEPIAIPPLRDRPEDIGGLVAHFGGGAMKGIEPSAFRAISLHHWPRNVRELDEVIKRAVTLAGDRKIRPEDLPAPVREALQTGPRFSAPRKYRAGPGRAELEGLLRAHDGNIAAVAKALDRHWNVVQRWVRRHGIDVERFRR